MIVRNRKFDNATRVIVTTRHRTKNRTDMHHHAISTNDIHLFSVKERDTL